MDLKKMKAHLRIFKYEDLTLGIGVGEQGIHVKSPTDMMMGFMKMC